MKIPKAYAYGFQKKLYHLSYDCYVADAFTSGLCGLLDNQIRWQTAVDTLHRLIRSDLLWSEEDPALGQQDYLEYVEKLAQNDPFSADTDAVWISLDFCLTDAGRELVNKHKLRERTQDELCEPFIEELEQLFEAHGVGWSDEPLIPIRSAT